MNNLNQETAKLSRGRVESFLDRAFGAAPPSPIPEETETHHSSYSNRTSYKTANRSSYKTAYSNPSPPPSSNPSPPPSSTQETSVLADPKSTFTRSSDLKPTHADNLRARSTSATDVTATTATSSFYSLTKDISHLSMYESDSNNSGDDDDDDASSEYDHSLISNALTDKDVDRRPPSGHHYERSMAKLNSTLTAVSGRTEKLVEGQNKGLEMLTTMGQKQDKGFTTMGQKQDKALDLLNGMDANQDKRDEQMTSMAENIQFLKQRALENDPTFKEQLAKQRALYAKQTAELLKQRQKADDLQARIDKEYIGKTRAKKKPAAILSNSTNTNAPHTKAEKKAETKHAARFDSETQKKAAVLKSKRGRTLYGGDGF